MKRLGLARSGDTGVQTQEGTPGRPLIPRASFGVHRAGHPHTLTLRQQLH